MSVEEDKTKALAALRAAHENVQKADEEVTQTVVDARHVKATWAGIATELGIAQPNAVRKFKPLLEERTPRQKWEHEADPAGPSLLAVRHAHKKAGDAELARLQAVADARSAGVTWEAIATVLGMKVPNAVSKYLPLLEETRVVTVRRGVGSV
ncbi:hypothetical protein [Streptosporangium sp. NPDC002721]|uniref:hypothetical protein n=1 Tax=Streptosporangium sp. NPDC002721 TaxID=3366188 RepID=UPI003694464A